MEPSKAVIAFLITVTCVSAAVVPGKHMVSTHMAYDCVTSWKVPRVNGNSIPSRNLSFALIRNQSAAKLGIQSYQCALTESVTADGTVLLIAISADEHCDGLLKPYDHHVKDGKMVMLLYQNSRRPLQPIDRPTREVTDEQCRFSDFTQGEWLNLRVDGGTLQYVHVVHHDEIDSGEQKGDDETGQQTRIRRQIYSDPTVLDGDEIRKYIIQWDNARSRRSLSDVIASSLPIPSGPTPPPSPPPTPPHTPSRTQSRVHSTYNSMFEAKDLIKSFDTLIEEYEQLINNDKEYKETRRKRSFTQKNNPTKYRWRCVRRINNEDSLYNQRTGAKFLTWGGKVEEHVDQSGNQQLDNGNSSTPVSKGKDYKMTYSCLWFVLRGPNILEYSVVGTGLPKPDQDLKSFARELCKENKSGSRGFDVIKRKNLNPRREWWATESSDYIPLY